MKKLSFLFILFSFSLEAHDLDTLSSILSHNYENNHDYIKIKEELTTAFEKILTYSSESFQYHDFGTFQKNIKNFEILFMTRIDALHKQYLKNQKPFKKILFFLSIKKSPVFLFFKQQEILFFSTFDHSLSLNFQSYTSNNSTLTKDDLQIIFFLRFINLNENTNPISLNSFKELLSLINQPDSELNKNIFQFFLPVLNDQNQLRENNEKNNVIKKFFIQSFTESLAPILYLTGITVETFQNIFIQEM